MSKLFGEPHHPHLFASFDRVQSAFSTITELHFQMLPSIAASNWNQTSKKPGDKAMLIEHKDLDYNMDTTFA
ncbi:hypothetical protein X798_01842 [Onchocerca flexuosa]|uniref:DHC_N2 domain-containing protein n=2 Tax=Onchocerca flexuosa TaxID=387005 RepID=A0A183HH21_9BILA|nr:hypothetical protein X798_01842 [Onchocerca flexuosa]VDO47902.1 unnamed protein product [Onchocerca flexuosa]